MVKCNKCPVVVECKSVGRISVKSKEGVLIKVCPLLWAVDTLMAVVNKTKHKVEVKEVEVEKPSEDSALQTD